MPRQPLGFVLLLAVTCAAQEPVLQNSHTTENLRGVSAPSHAVVWASGTHGTYLRTVDAGKSWLVAQAPGAEALDFRDVEAFGADVAYLLSAGPGEQSRIYKTTNAGQHWALQFTNKDPQGFLDCMAFWDRNHGITLGDPVNGKFVLLATRDGGKHWKQLPAAHLPSAIEGEGAFAASGSCITVAAKNHVWFATGGAAARVFHSTNRGQTWSVVDTPLPRGNASSGIFSIAFSDVTHGVIAGGDYKNPDQGESSLAVTTDGGRTWRALQVSPQTYVSAVATRASLAVLTVGPTRAAYTHKPEGRTWRKSWSISLNAATFDPLGTAIGVGAKGTIVRFPLLP